METYWDADADSDEMLNETEIALTADEETFVQAFVEYWIRRGAELVRIRP